MMSPIQHSRHVIRHIQHSGAEHKLKNLTHSPDSLSKVIEKINPKVISHPKSMADPNGTIFGMALLLGINTLAVVSAMDNGSKSGYAALSENERYNLLKQELFNNKHASKPALSFIDFSILNKTHKAKPNVPKIQSIERAPDMSLFRGLTLLELGTNPKGTVDNKKISQLEKDIVDLKDKVEADKKQRQWTYAALMASQFCLLISVMASRRAGR